jgi:hypothetical protein
VARPASYLSPLQMPVDGPFLGVSRLRNLV